MKKTNVSKAMLRRKSTSRRRNYLEELKIKNKHELDLMEISFNQKMKELRERQDLKLKEQEKAFEEKIKQQKLDFEKRDKELAEDFAKRDKIYDEKKRQQLLDFELKDKEFEEKERQQKLEFEQRDKCTEENEKKHKQNREIISDIKDLAVSIIKQAPSLLIDSFTIYHNYQTVKKEPDPYKQDQMIQNGFLFRNIRDDDFVGNGRTAI